MANQYCCSIPQPVIELELTSTRAYSKRSIKFFHCKRCQRTWLFKEFTARDGKSYLENITKRKEALDQYSRLKREIIPPYETKRRKHIKPLYPRGYRYLNGKDGTIRNLKTDLIYEKFDSPMITRFDSSVITRFDSPVIITRLEGV
jgi:hypothetical protein